MSFVPIAPPEGLVLNGTEYDTQGRWRLANMVRFFRGSPQPVGGWTNLPLTWKDPDGKSHNLDRLVGACRGLISWRDNDEKRWMAIGTTRKLYVFDGSEILDVTPAGLLPGEENANYGSGFGAYYYSEDHEDPEAHTGGSFAYSTERPQPITSLVQEPGAWTMASWGEDLIVCPNWDGKIYKWSPGDTLATQVVAAGGVVPEAVRAVLVSNERHMIAIGSGDWSGAIWTKNQRRIMWSNAEDHDDWTPVATNSAGDLQLETKGVAVTGAEFRGEILIWTDIDVHRMFYTGAPYYYGIKKLSPVAGTVSVNAHVVTSEFVFWVGPKGFYMYDGSVRPLAPDVSDYYRDGVNRNQIAKVACGHNPQFKEIWTFYPSKGSQDNDSYIIWNYENNTWTIGGLNRTCWDEAAIWDFPVAARSELDDAGPTPEETPHDEYRVDIALNVAQYYGTFVFDEWFPVFDNGSNATPSTMPYPRVETVRLERNSDLFDYTEGVDFEVNYEQGLFKALSTGGMTGAPHRVHWTTVDNYPSYLYNHEDGFTDAGASRDVWLELSPFEISTGDNLAVVKRIIQDTGREADLDPALNSNAIEISFKTRLAPEAASVVEGPYTLDTDRGYTDVRFTGRQVSMKVQQVKDELWRLGKFRLDVVPGSGR